MRPPELIDAGAVVLKRWEPAWAAEAAEAIHESLPQLAPFLAWATADQDTAASVAYIERSVAEWAEGREFNYAIFTDAGDFAGSISLTTRMGPGVLEIGYWLRSSCTGRGYTTAAAGCLPVGRSATSLALGHP